MANFTGWTDRTRSAFVDIFTERHVTVHLIASFTSEFSTKFRQRPRIDQSITGTTFTLYTRGITALIAGAFVRANKVISTGILAENTVSTLVSILTLNFIRTNFVWTSVMELNFTRLLNYFGAQITVASVSTVYVFTSFETAKVQNMVATVVSSKSTLVDVNAATIIGFVPSWTRSAADATYSVDANIVTAVVVIDNTLVTVNALVSIRTQLKSGFTDNRKAIRTTQKITTLEKDFIYIHVLQSSCKLQNICSTFGKSLASTLAIIRLIATLVGIDAVYTTMSTGNSKTLIDIHTTAVGIVWIG